MNNQNLIIYKFSELYHIFEEISSELNFKIIEISNENALYKKIDFLNNYLVLTNYKKINIQNLMIIENLPIKISKLLERINVKFLKMQFSNQSHIKVNQYTINLNSREMIGKNIKLKLTEKEINTIIYLSKAQNPVSVEKLEKSVWGYQSDIETHTVETHIYRLRKKVFKSFNDKEFIKSKKNGYKIN
jgi:hypothetical protein